MPEHVPTKEELDDAVLLVGDYVAQHLKVITASLEAAGHRGIAEKLERLDNNWRLVTYARIVNTSKQGASALLRELA